MFLPGGLAARVGRAAKRRPAGLPLAAFSYLQAATGGPPGAQSTALGVCMCKARYGDGLKQQQQGLAG